MAECGGVVCSIASSTADSCALADGFRAFCEQVQTANQRIKFITSPMSSPRKLIFALGLALGVLGLSLVGWRVGAGERGLRWQGQLQPAATPAPISQSVRSGPKVEASLLTKL